MKQTVRCDICSRTARVIYRGKKLPWFACGLHDEDIRRGAMKTEDGQGGLTRMDLKDPLVPSSPVTHFETVTFFTDWVVRMVWVAAPWTDSSRFFVEFYRVIESSNGAIKGRIELRREFDEDQPIFHAHKFIDRFLKNLPPKARTMEGYSYRQEALKEYSVQSEPGLDLDYTGGTRWFTTAMWSPSAYERTPIPQMQLKEKPSFSSWLEGRWQGLADRLSAVLDRHGITRFSAKADIIQAFMAELPKE